MKIRFAVVAAATAFTALPALAADLQVGTGTTFSITGFLAVGLSSSSVDNASVLHPGMKTEMRIDDNTSRIAFNGSSKIADGWNAIFSINSRFTADVRPGDQVLNGNTLTVGQASGWADDDTWAGVSSPYGRVIVGKNSFYWGDTVSLGHIAPSLENPGESYRVWQVQGLSTFTILDQAITMPKAQATGLTSGAMANAYTLGITRSRNVIRFDSINYSGVDFALAWTKNAVGGELWYPGINTPNATSYARSYSEGGTTYARVRYNGNGLSLSASYVDQKLQGGVYSIASYNGPLDLTAYRLGASYKWQGFKAGVVMDTTTYANGVSASPFQAAVGASVGDATRTAFEVPLSYTYGDHMFHFTYAKAGNVSDAKDSGANQVSLAWDYALNKKTFVSLQYTKLKNDANGHYAPFLTNYSFGTSAPNQNTATVNVNGEGFSQLQAAVHFWF
jgi:hypothetical protein